MLNNKNFIVVGDLHCSPTTLEITYKVIQMLNRYPNHTPIFLGDFFNSKAKFDSRFLVQLFSILSLLDREALVLSGNHDFIDSETSIISILPKNYKPIVTPSSFTVDDTSMVFLPYTTATEDSIAFIKEHNTDNSILFSHIVIEGFSPVKLDGFSSNIFSNYKAVLNGHIHTSSNKGNIFHLGAVYPVATSEIASFAPYMVLIDNLNIADIIPLEFFTIVTTNEYKPELNAKNILIKTDNEELLAQYDNVFKIAFTGTKGADTTIAPILNVNASFSEVFKTQIESAELTEDQLEMLKLTMPKEYNIWTEENIKDDIINGFKNLIATFKECV